MTISQLNTEKKNHYTKEDSLIEKHNTVGVKGTK